MKKNMGNADRIFRIIVAILIIVLYFTHVITGTFGIVLMVLGAVFVLTSLVAFCPIYSLVGASTCPTKKG